MSTPLPALAEVQQVLQQAAAEITGDEGDTLRRRLRTGTVLTYDDRNWELRWARNSQQINLARAIAVDMESSVAAQGYRLRVPYGTLLCVLADKPLHREMAKPLPGPQDIVRRAVAQHLHIGIRALELMRSEGRYTLHWRKLRSFDEPPFSG